jgi:hypothetical protein
VRNVQRAGVKVPFMCMAHFSKLQNAPTYKVYIKRKTIEMKHGEKYKIQLLEDPSIRNPYAIKLDKIYS